MKGCETTSCAISAQLVAASTPRRSVCRYEPFVWSRAFRAVYGFPFVVPFQLRGSSFNATIAWMAAEVASVCVLPV